MIVCDKPVKGAGPEASYPRPIALLEQRITRVLTEAEDAALKKKANKVMIVLQCVTVPWVNMVDWDRYCFRMACQSRL